MNLSEHIDPIEDYDDPDLIAWQIANAPTFPEYEPNDEEAYGRHLEIEAANQPVMTPGDEYELLMAADDYVDDVVSVALRQSREAAEEAMGSGEPWTQFLSTAGAEAVAPEMVVDWVFAAGLLVIAGQRGSGKTLTLLTQALSVAGVYNEHPTPSRIRRKVIYITEDVNQIRTIILGLRMDGKITASVEEVDEWLKLVPSKRLKPKKLKKLKQKYSGMIAPNLRVDGTYYNAPPLLVMDTLAACVQVDKIESNGEMSGAVSVVRETFRGMPVWLVTHISKADAKKMAKLDPDNMTAIGAQSLEGDVQGTAYIAIGSDKNRAVLLGKTRFESKQRRFKVVTHTVPMRLPNVLGEMEEFLIRYNEMTPEEPSASTVKDETTTTDESREVAKRAIIAFVASKPACSQAQIYKAVEGVGDGKKKKLLEELEREGMLVIKPASNGNGFEHTVAPQAMPSELINDNKES